MSLYEDRQRRAEQTRARNKRVTAAIAASELAKKIPQAVPDSADMNVIGPKVIDLYRGVGYSVFLYLDDSGGYMHGKQVERYWLVRSVRNHPIWGKRLFAVLDPKK